MDRHNVENGVTPEQVAEIHKQDLLVQDRFNCKVISYFFDNKRNNVFCLVEAPDKKSMMDMHAFSHGDIPNKVIEVEESVLDSFLGQIDLPKVEQPNDVYINRSSLTRVIMVVNIQFKSLEDQKCKPLEAPLKSFNETIVAAIKQNKGKLVQQQMGEFIIIFTSAVSSISCAVNLQSNFKLMDKDYDLSNVHFKIGIDLGIPISKGDHLYENTVKLAQRICNVVKEQVVVSNEVKNAYNDEKLNVLAKSELVHVLNQSNEKFLNLLMDYIENSWDNPNYKVTDIAKHIGISKSQLYRNIISLTGKSPNAIIKEYKLRRALILLDEQQKNITEISYDTGFNSPAYFSKCFVEKYGILPSTYDQLEHGSV